MFMKNEMLNSVPYEPTLIFIKYSGELGTKFNISFFKLTNYFLNKELDNHPTTVMISAPQNAGQNPAT